MSTGKAARPPVNCMRTLHYTRVAPIIGSVIGLTMYQHDFLSIGIGSYKSFNSKPIQ